MSGTAPLGSARGASAAGQARQVRVARKSEILRCPWHGWEFDITAGRSIFNPRRTRVQTNEVTVEPHGEAVDTCKVTVEDGALILHM